jgi:resuscitation-promoting factor RpfB
MKLLRGIFLALGLLLFVSCQPKSVKVTILDGSQIYSLTSAQHIPAELLAAAEVGLEPEDRLLYLGTSTPLDVPLPDAAYYTLTVRRAVTLTVVTPDGTQTLQTSALTVGQALAEAGYTLSVADRVSPPVETPLAEGLSVTYQLARPLVVTVDGIEVRIRSGAGTVGQALAEAGIPLVGLDYSLPSEDSPLPSDGNIHVVHVVESVALTQKSIPYGTRTELSADLELDQQALIQGGETGLAIARLRTRSEDGMQVSQTSESESIVRPPQDQVLGIGTKIVIRTAVVDGVTIEYWRVLNLLATSYSPCRSGTEQCLYGTSSGMRVQKGVVAMVYSWYLAFGFENLYIPGYGHAVVGDVGGGPAGSHYWIDLGYSDSDWVNWYQTVTVYFLTPVPANPVYILP